MPDPNILSSTRVRLTALDEKDLETVASWYQDAGFLRQLDADIARPRTESELQAWMANAHKSNSGFLFAIRPVEGDEILGFLEIDGILWNQQTGFVSLAIGDHRHRGQGYGHEAMQLALRFAFDELNLHRLSLNVFSYNQRAIALYEKMGFQREGVQREAIHRQGKRYDLIWYGLLRHDWQARQA